MPKRKRLLLSGNEAIALGAYEAGTLVATGYPGTPATEILEALSLYDGVYAEWSVNEKVALEVASGASIAGVRALCAMKHVGLNVAADPLMTLGYTGVKGGLVVVSADDPGHHSSQNEQDNRNYARFAKVPMLEPSNSDEAYAFTRLAFELSERFDTPVLVRTTTRVSHSKSPVCPGRPHKPRVPSGLKPEPSKYVMIPGYSEARHDFAEKRLTEMAGFADGFEHNRVEMRSRDIGVITSGITYHYVREALPEASVLKLGMSYPLPAGLVKDFASGVSELYVAEELDPFIETQTLALGVDAVGKLTRPGFLPLSGELNPDIISAAFGRVKRNMNRFKDRAFHTRPPAMCPGCPHRGVFYTLSKHGYFVAGDIGCYTLAHNEPLSAVHTTLCMGAGLGQAHGILKAFEAASKSAPRLAAVIGDSTFLHSGMTSLLNTMYNRGSGVIVILDNLTTAMTGRQTHPGTGRTLSGERTKKTDIVDVVKGLGVKDVIVVDPYELAELEKALGGKARKGLRVIVTRRPCFLLDRKQRRVPMIVDTAACTGCGDCIDTACPAISLKEGVAHIDQTLCTGCMICRKVCGYGAIRKARRHA